jgi:hypothetical protein
VLGGITGPPCHWGILGPGPPAWGLDAGLTTLLCKKKKFVTKSKEMKTGCNLQTLRRKRGQCFANDDDDDDDEGSLQYSQKHSIQPHPESGRSSSYIQGPF